MMLPTKGTVTVCIKYFPATPDCLMQYQIVSLETLSYTSSNSKKGTFLEFLYQHSLKQCISSTPPQMLASQLANTINIYQNAISVPVQSKVYCAQGQKQQQQKNKKTNKQHLS